MVTKVKFKALRNGKVVYKTLPIEHNFEVIPASNYKTLSFPETSIEYQVIEYLDTIDKREIMLKNEWDIIIDYFIPVEKQKKTKEERILSFLEFATPYLEAYPSLKVPFRAIISEKTDELFGKSQKNEKI